ncbi:hypothetical protein ACIQXD_29115 [Streptomyces uncialis]|uniref:hypothetical protein n=1 Tax=Streptomyces uncialis TaxID=1048205 RepID=UPI003809736F
MLSGARREPPPPADGVRRPHGTRTFTGDTGEVHSVAVSPDGTRLAASGMDGEVRPWDRCSPSHGHRTAKAQVKPDQDASGMPEDPRSPHPVRRTPHAQRRRKTGFPGSERFCLGTMVGRVGLEPTADGL